MSRLLQEFNIKSSQNKFEEKDYEAFKDKELLNEFRLNILEDLSDNGFNKEKVNSEIIHAEIDNVTYGYELTPEERNYLFHLIDGEINGYGPLTELLNDDAVTEIMVNSPSDIYIEIDGVLQKDNSVSFINNEHIIRTIERLVGSSKKGIDINNPMVDARLEDGSRINAIIPPLSKNPIITIRKFKKNIVSMDDLVGNGTLTPYMARFLEAAVLAKLNIIISGSAGAGKTTLLNILSNFINEKDRIITIEDVMELNLKQENVVSLETRSANYDGIGEVTMRQLVYNSLRMRPDRIIIGEVRGVEAFDLLQAMNTGHDGAMTTLHASGAKDAIHRMETMILMNGLDIPIPAIRDYISNAIDLVVYIVRMKDGKRKITSISEVTGVKNGEVELHEIFNFKIDGVSTSGNVQGEFKLFEQKPRVLTKIQGVGIDLVDDMFK